MINSGRLDQMQIIGFREAVAVSFLCMGHYEEILFQIPNFFFLFNFRISRGSIKYTSIHIKYHILV